MIDADCLPPHIILVNEDYPIDCTTYVAILNPKQKRYIVNGHGVNLEKSMTLKVNAPESDDSLQVKASKARKWDDNPEKQTPPRSQSQSQRDLLHDDNGSTPGVWLAPQEPEKSELVQSPTQTSVLDRTSSRNSEESADGPALGSFSGFCEALE